jgi:hypothetical protein
MEQTEGQGLFDSKLNETGKMYIRKFAAATRWLLLLGILLAIVHVTISIIRLAYYDVSRFSGDKVWQFEYRILPFYSLTYTTLALLQLYYYWKVGKELKKGADYNDETALNNAFMALYRNAVYAVILFVMAFLMNLLDLYGIIKIYIR